MQSSLEKYDRLADRIRLHRQVDKRPVVVVEGPSDRRLIDDIANAAAVVFVAATRDKVLNAAQDLVSMHVEQVACVVDRDFDEAVHDAQENGLPVLAYYGTDLEEMLIHSPALSRVLGELASEQKLRSYGGVDALLTTAVESSLPLARLRRANALENWGLAFDAVDTTTKINRDTLAISIRGLCTALRQTSDTSPELASLLLVAEEEGSGVCPQTGRPRVRGRDALAVVGVALRKVVGTRAKAQTSGDHLADILRSAVDYGWVRQSGWFEELVGLLGIPLADPPLTTSAH